MPERDLPLTPPDCYSKAPESFELKIGDRVPVPKRKLEIRPAFTGAGKSSFKPARNGKRR